MNERKIALLREVEYLRSQLAQMEDIKCVILFGSLTTDDIDRWSDIDIIVLMETSEPPIRRIYSLLRKLDYKEPLDLMVYTPEEFERLKETVWWRSAGKNAEVLYERK